MIPLSAINATAVLRGARVKLNPPHPRDGRFEWVGDVVLAQCTPRFPETWAQLREIPDWLALNPTDPDTLRLIDRRITEGLYQFSDLVAAHLWIEDSTCWRLSIIHPDGTTQEARCLHGCLRDLPLITENIPIARARLLKALYPPEKT